MIAVLLCAAAGATPAQAAATWTVQNPPATSLNALTCSTSSNCWAVGAKGAISATTDAGLTWNAQSSGVTKALNDVACAGPSTCIAVGATNGNGTNLLRTVDGGATWSSQSSATTQDLTAVSCAGATTCWAAGAGGVIVATTNGGTTWSAQTSGVSKQVEDLACPTTSVCFAVSTGKVLKTVNGGVTWTSQASGTSSNLLGIACPSSSVCFGAGPSGTIMATTNGTTWSAQSSSTANQLNEVACASTSRCWAVGAAGAIVATTNGGATWSAQTSGRTTALNSVACLSTTTCGAVGANGAISGTTDGGATWIPLTAGTTTTLNGVSCISSSTCWAVGANGTIVATTNAGTSWVLQNSGYTKNLNGISCPDSSTCFVVGATNGSGTNGIVLKTVDGGATWSPQNSNTTQNLNSVSCISTTTCWAVGQGGVIVSTTNGGSTWGAQTSGVTQALTSIACVSGGTCYAVGALASGSAVLVKTANSGTTWSPQTSNSAAQLNDVSCADAANCTSVGASGAIVTTSNGTTWTARTSGTAVALNGVACVDSLTCWAVGNNSGGGTNAVVLATTNGGAAWSADVSNTTNQLQAVSFVGISNGWAVGNGGAIDWYLNDTTPPAAPTIDASPVTPGMDRLPSWSFSGEDGATFECLLERGTTTISGWAPCAGEQSYDLIGEPDGTYTFSVRATDSAGNTGSPATSNYTLDTTAPADPAITASPTSPGSGTNPAWSFTGDGSSLFECRVERTGVAVYDWAACSSGQSFSLGLQSDGAFAFLVRARDAAGNVSGQVSGATYTLDRVAPTDTLITGSPSSPAQDRSPSWSFSGEGTFECQLSDSGGPISAWGACTSPKSYSLSGRSDGVYTFSARAIDSAGNTGNPVTSNYTLDTGAPTDTAISSSPVSPDNDRSPSWSFTGEGTFQCRLDRGGAIVSGWAGCSSPKSYNLNGQPDGTYTFSVQATDSAGNQGPVRTSTFELDTTGPAGPTISSPPSSPGNSLSPSWSFSSEANATFECQLDRSGFVVFAWAACSSAKSYSLSGQPDGSYTFSVRSTDQAGNTGGVSTSDYVLDTAAPGVPSITESPDSPGNDIAPAWTFGGGSGTYECRLDRGATQIAGWAACTSPQSYSLAGRPDGTYTFSLRTTDLAGNRSVAVTSDLVLDTSVPATPVIGSVPGAVGRGRNPQWSFTGDPSSTFECRLDRGTTQIHDWAACTSAKAYSLVGEPDGAFKFSVRGVSSGGTRGAADHDVYMLDTAAPAVPVITTPPPAVGSARNPSWSFTAEAGALVECRVDRGPTQIYDWAPCSSPKALDLGGRSDGTYTLTLRATDQAGNVGSEGSGTYELDTTAPAAPAVDAPQPVTNNAQPAFSFSTLTGNTYECRLLGAGGAAESFQPCATPARYDLGGSGDRSFTFEVRATDAAGNTGPAGSAGYQLDRTAAAARIASGPGPIGHDRIVAWGFDAEPGASFECNLSLDTTTVFDWAGCASPYGYDLTGRPDGTYTFAVRAGDPAGNVGAIAQERYELDTAAPAKPVVKSSPASPGADRTPTWSFTGEAGATLECGVVRGKTATPDFSDCASPKTFDLRGKADGTFHFVVRARDLAGNVSASANDLFELDTTDPVTPTIDHAPSSADSDRSPTWQFSGEDGSTFECRLVRGNDTVEGWAPCRSPKTYDLSGASGGTFTFEVRAIDSAGNTGRARTDTYEIAAAEADPPSSDASPAPPPAGPSDPTPPAAAPATDPAIPAPVAPADANHDPAKPGEDTKGEHAGGKKSPVSAGPAGGGARNAPDSADSGGGAGGAVGRSGGSESGGRHEKKHGPAAVAEAVGKALGQAAKVIAKNADKSVFPFSLILIVFGFLGIQSRIDRSDPKLALAPLHADPDLEFLPPPTEA